MSVKKTKLVLGCLLFLAMAAMWVACRYQVERIQALSMQAMLVNTAIAEDAYYHKHQQFTDDWKTLLLTLTRPDSLETDLAPVPGRPEAYFFGFGQGTAQKHRGFEVVLQLKNNGQEILMTATRIGGGYYHYQLQRPLPHGQTRCLPGLLAKSFCRQLLDNADLLEIKNFVPVPDQKEHKQDSTKIK